MALSLVHGSGPAVRAQRQVALTLRCGDAPGLVLRISKTRLPAEVDARTCPPQLDRPRDSGIIHRSRQDLDSRAGPSVLRSWLVSAKVISSTPRS
jgi:hypothetical protein